MSAATVKFRLSHHLLAATLAVLALLVRLVLSPALAASVPYITFYLAVMLSAWVGGLGPGLLCMGITALGAWYFVLPPVNSFQLTLEAAFGLFLYLAVAGFISWLTERTRRAERAEAEQRRFSELTLAAIGDAVIATGQDGRVTYMNAVASNATGWTLEEARGIPLPEVFPIVDEESGAPVENPAVRPSARERPRDWRTTPSW
jgi:PAS domain-containing protein